METSPDAVSASALLAIAYVHEGYWERAIPIAAKLQELAPRESFRDFDPLVKGYALLYIDCDKSAATLHDVIEWHSSWTVARAFLAAALAHVAERRNDPSQLRRAIREIDIARSVHKDNPFVLLISAFIYKLESEFRRKAGKPLEDVRRIGLNVAGKLRQQFPNYVAGTALAAQFYEEVGERELAEDERCHPDPVSHR